MPDNTEREALARLIDAHYDDYEPVYNEGGEAVSSTLADAILAAGFHRTPAPDVQALIDFVHDAGLTSAYGRLDAREVSELNAILQSVEVSHSVSTPQDTEWEYGDRWLAEHDRQVAERAWDEGFTRGFYAGQSYPDGTDASEPDIDNPYRKEQEESKK